MCGAVPSRKDEARGRQVWLSDAEDPFCAFQLLPANASIADGGACVQSLAALAASGNAEAHLRLYFAFRDGKGAEKDDAKALQHVETAAKAGHAIAQTSLGFCFAKGVGVAADKARAVQQYAAAAEQGEVFGM